MSNYKQPVTSSESVSLLLRDFEAGDANFILRTWLRSYRQRIHTIPDTLYYEHQQTLIRRLAMRSRVSIASNKEDPAFIMGFCVAEPLEEGTDDEPLRVHFAFTKLTYRQCGIATAMLRQLGWNERRTIHLSHWTHAARSLNDAGKFRLVNNPFMLMEIPGAHKYAAIKHREGHVQDVTDVSVGQGDGPGARGQS